ncbi:MAG: polymer-forming cytoskeletal protein [Bacteroidia bacterium]
MAIFNSNKNTTFNPQEINIINAGTTINGDLASEGDLRIDGTITGNVNVKTKLVLGSSSNIKGNIQATNCDISGEVKGNITIAELLTIKATAKINGDIQCTKLIIEAGAEFNGKSSMKPENDIKNSLNQNNKSSVKPTSNTVVEAEKATI